MSGAGTSGQTVAMTLDRDNRRAEFSMRGADWRGGAFVFSLAPEAGGFLVRVRDAVDPLEERHATWEEAVDAFAEDVRLHVRDVLRGLTEEQDRSARETLGQMSNDEARRLLRAILG